MNNIESKDFSLILFIGILLNKIPFPIIQIFLNVSLKIMYHKHKRIFEKVSQNKENSFLIEPIDLPFNFYLVVDSINPSLEIVKKNFNLIPSATIKASLKNLLGLFEGKVDGDAAFFSKDLIVEGSTVAIVSLRNAIDAEDIDIINDLSENFGIFKKIIQKIFAFSILKYNNVNNVLKIIQSSLLKDYELKNEKNVEEILILKTEVEKLKSALLKRSI